MKKWVVITVGVVAVVAIVGVVLTVRASLQMKKDWQEYAGKYVAASGSYQAKADDVLELRADGTWTHSRGPRTIDEGGEPSDLPGESDLEQLNWLGPSAAADCLGSVEAHCPQPTFPSSGADLIYVPTSYQQTTNKGDYETGGNYYRVLKDGDVLVDEQGVRWVLSG